MLRIELKLFAEDKSVVVRITDPEACSRALGASFDGALLEDLADFADDVLQSNSDAGVVEITPENVTTVLKSAAAVMETITGNEPVAPIETAPPAAPVTVHDADATIAPPAAEPEPAAQEPAAAVTETPEPASTVHDADATIAPETPAN